MKGKDISYDDLAAKVKTLEGEIDTADLAVYVGGSDKFTVTEYKELTATVP